MRNYSHLVNKNKKKQKTISSWYQELYTDLIVRGLLGTCLAFKLMQAAILLMEQPDIPVARFVFQISSGKCTHCITLRAWSKTHETNKKYYCETKCNRWQNLNITSIILYLSIFMFHMQLTHIIIIRKNRKISIVKIKLSFLYKHGSWHIFCAIMRILFIDYRSDI